MRQNGATIRSGGRPHAPDVVAAPTRRCAVYCRKSVEERQATDFSSIDAQREAGETYVHARQDRGWALLADRYADEGYTGANTERPALKALLADIEARRVDVVVVYKVDRLSRSLLDFARLLEAFERHGVAFVSVTQEIDTTTSMGRLMLNVLFSFAQFEREMISERTRDKMRAARRKGKFVGGNLLLGYDRHPEGRRLVVNPKEAERVRALFDLYLERRSLTEVVAEASARDWATKSWVARHGRRVEPRPLTTGYLRALLRNPAYVGRVRVDGEMLPAVHEGIVVPEVFEKVQSLLATAATCATRPPPRPSAALLAGILRCGPCDAPMGHAHTTRRGRRYGYYVCRTTRERGWAACPSKSVPAAEIERLVVDQIRAIGGDNRVQSHTLEAVRAQAPGHEIDADDLRRALSLWDGVWEALLPAERARVLRLLVQEVRYDGGAGTVALTFHPTGIAALAREVGE